MHEPRISVLLPVYNGMPYLRQAVESVLGQTFGDFELIVLDDASTDGTADYLEGVCDERLRVVLRPKSGLAVNLNVGLEQARAEVIARMDADDVCRPERFERQYEVMAGRPEVVVCGCQVWMIGGGGEDRGLLDWPVGEHKIRYALLTHAAFSHPGVMVRKEAILAAGGYRPEWVPSEDYELWCRLAVRGGAMMNLEDVLLDYRVHAANISTVRRAQQMEFLRRISAAYLVGAGYARSEQEAGEFFQIAQGSEEARAGDMEGFVRVFERFIGTSGFEAGEVEELRVGARHKVMGVARRFGRLGRLRAMYAAWRVSGIGLIPSALAGTFARRGRRAAGVLGSVQK